MTPQEFANDHIAGLLATCEETPPDKHPVVQITAAGHHVLIVSDLHISAGRSTSGTYEGTENFFADDAFARMLNHVDRDLSSIGGRRGLLVINGDFVDFLRVRSLPENDADFSAWENMLIAIGVTDRPREFLVRSISDKERDFGLKTHDYKSVWKLGRVIQGHPAVFAALASWLNRGHRLVIVKGNHDLEWYWKEVRDFLRLTLARHLQVLRPAQGLNICLRDVVDRLQFVDDACVIDGQVYVEHGHRYDRFANVIGQPTWGAPDVQLNIPFGSFFNRYLLNRVELAYPFVDNVRPQQNIIHLLMREKFFVGLKVLFHYMPFTIRMIPKKYVRYMLKPVSAYLLAFGVPLVAVLVLWGNRLIPLISSATSSAPAAVEVWGGLLQALIGMVKDGALLFLSYLLSRFVAFVQLEEPGDLMNPAKKKMTEYPSCRLITMGHTHNPEEFSENARWYINSSTWIPIIESSSGSLRDDKTYALIYLERDQAGGFLVKPLQRWNDDAGRIEPMVIVEDK